MRLFPSDGLVESVVLPGIPDQCLPRLGMAAPSTRWADFGKLGEGGGGEIPSSLSYGRKGRGAAQGAQKPTRAEVMLQRRGPLLPLCP